MLIHTPFGGTIHIFMLLMPAFAAHSFAPENFN